MSIQELQAPVDAVVVSDRHQVHPPFLGLSVNFLGSGVRVPTFEERKMARVARVIGVNVEIGFERR
jgi:hypothetical protein